MSTPFGIANLISGDSNFVESNKKPKQQQQQTFGKMNSVAIIPPSSSLPPSSVVLPAPVTVDGTAPAIIPTTKAGEGESNGREQQLDETLAKIMKIIESPHLSEAEAKIVMHDSIHNWKEHINPGFLAYRKSVAAGQSFASIEWTDDHENPGGSTVLDVFGNKYIDMLGGYGIYNCGHSHPKIMKAVKTQLDKQPLHSQELLDYLRGYCAQALSMTFPDTFSKKTTTVPSSSSSSLPQPPSSSSSSSPQFHENALRYAFFTNSGTESVEACLKMAMLATGGRRHFIGLVGAFHGKTLGSLSGTSKAAFRTPFAGGLLPFTHIPVNDIEALKTVFASCKFTGTEIAGVLIEPILGEGGIHVCSNEFLRAARDLCDEHGSMLIFDEVQSGMGRTGKMWACEWANVSPDLMAIGKAFGGGVVGAGAAVGSYRAWHKYFENPFLHTTTFGGNPLSMAAAIATLQVLRTEHLVEAAHEKGEYFKAKLEALCSKHPLVMKEIRGRGLMLGIEFQDNDLGFTFSKGVFSRGILLSGTLVNARTIRVEPPLTVTYEEINTTLGIFATVLDEMEVLKRGDGDGDGGSSDDVAADSSITTTTTIADAATATDTTSTSTAFSGAGAGALPLTSEDSCHRLSIDSTASSDTDPDPFEVLHRSSIAIGGVSSSRVRFSSSSSSSSSSAATSTRPSASSTPTPAESSSSSPAQGDKSMKSGHHQQQHHSHRVSSPAGSSDVTSDAESHEEDDE